ncbi:MAG: hypothetical protein QOD32_1051 [Pyrinomonadaceae bacterium]|jgi:hypothetical protein|nr:hypothetical protein [Pyrinomonadaceae bacterium]
MNTTVVQDIPRRLRAKAILVVVAGAFFAFVSISCDVGGAATERRRTATVDTERRTATVADDSQISRAFESRASDVQVEGEGSVTRVLPDDLDGRQHQRFLVRLASGQTVLIAHNIEIAPRIDGLKEGDSVSFYGEYVWNEKGGVIHWTHHDPQGRHVAGWVKHNNKTFK